MSKSFKVILEEHNNWINDARIELMKAAAVKDAFTDNRIMELDSDIENLEQDLENEKGLTTKLKGKLDGRDELLGELAVALENVHHSISEVNSLGDYDMGITLNPINTVLAKAKEVLP